MPWDTHGAQSSQCGRKERREGASSLSAEVTGYLLYGKQNEIRFVLENPPTRRDDRSVATISELVSRAGAALELPTAYGACLYLAQSRPKPSTTKAGPGCCPGEISSQGWTVKGTHTHPVPTTCQAPCRVLMPTLAHLLFTTAPRVRHYDPHLTEEKWAHRSQITCLRSHSCSEVEPGRAKAFHFQTTEPTVRLNTSDKYLITAHAICKVPFIYLPAAPWVCRNSCL